jgi:hypothetical protein
VYVHDGLRARQLAEAHGIDGVSRAIRPVDDVNSLAPDVRGEVGVFERKRRDRAELPEDCLGASVAEARREVGGPKVNVRYRLESKERWRWPRRVASAACHVDDETIPVEMTHEVRVDRGVGAEAVLRVQEQDVYLVSHFVS